MRLLGIVVWLAMISSSHAQEIEHLTLFGIGDAPHDAYHSTNVSLHAETPSYGGRVELQNEEDERLTFRERSLYLRRPVGELRLGNTESPADTLAVHPPTTAGSGGLDGYFIEFVSIPLALKAVTSERAAKLTYSSPPLPLSRGPDIPGQGQRISHQLQSGLSYSTFLNFTEFALAYQGDLPLTQTTPPTLHLGVALSSFEQERQYTSVQVGLRLDFIAQGLSFGATFVDYDQYQMKNNGFSLGIEYQNALPRQGPIVLGVSFSQVDSTPNLTSLFLDFAATYPLAPSLSVVGEIVYYSSSPDHGWASLIGLRLSIP